MTKSIVGCLLTLAGLGVLAIRGGGPSHESRFLPDPEETRRAVLAFESSRHGGIRAGTPPAPAPENFR